MTSLTAAASYDGLAARDFERLVGSPLVRIHDAVPSVLDIAHELGASGAPHGAIVLAGVQTAGRGRQGRAWSSPAGGLWLAFLARPDSPPSGGAMGLRAGLAVRQAVEAAAAECAPLLKWPNDLIVAERKAGGVLCEAKWNGTRLGWIAIGIGVNVAGPVAREVAGTAVALTDVAPHVTRGALLAALVPRLLATAFAPPELAESERAEFLAHQWTPAGEIAGHDLAPDGALLARRADGSLERRTAPA